MRVRSHVRQDHLLPVRPEADQFYIGIGYGHLHLNLGVVVVSLHFAASPVDYVHRDLVAMRGEAKRKWGCHIDAGLFGARRDEGFQLRQGVNGRWNRRLRPFRHLRVDQQRSFYMECFFHYGPAILNRRDARVAVEDGDFTIQPGHRAQGVQVRQRTDGIERNRGLIVTAHHFVQFSNPLHFKPLRRRTSQRQRGNDHERNDTHFVSWAQYQPWNNSGVKLNRTRRRKDSLDAAHEVGAIADRQKASVRAADHYEYQNQRDRNRLQQDDAEDRRQIDGQAQNVRTDGEAQADANCKRCEFQQQCQCDSHQQTRTYDISVNEERA